MNNAKYLEEMEQEMERGCLNWKDMGSDPRELVTFIMEQLRECARSLVNPQLFRLNLIRVGALVIASLQWTDDWIARLTIKHKLIEEPTNPFLSGPISNEIMDNEEEYKKAQEENE